MSKRRYGGLGYTSTGRDLTKYTAAQLKTGIRGCIRGARLATAEGSSKDAQVMFDRLEELAAEMLSRLEHPADVDARASHL